MRDRDLSDEAVGMIHNDEKSARREGLVSSFFAGTGRSYDDVVQLFTLGLDSYWKTEIVKMIPDSKRVLDLGCGTGILTECLAIKNPRSEIIGIDITPDYLEKYDERLKRKPWIRARSFLGNVETIALDGEFDAVVSSYLAKYVDPELLISNITPHLKRGGTFIAHDFILPRKPLYLASWLAYTRAMDHIGPILFPEWRNAFDKGFGLIRRTRWFDAFLSTLRKFGYDGVHGRRLSLETAGLVWATKA